MNNTRFATTIHILVLLTKFPEEWLSSEWIASSIDINPVIVRKELIYLQKAGIVSSRKGKEGGFKLDKNPEKIDMASIYLMIRSTEVLGKKNNHPSPKCPIGKKINEKLSHLYTEVESLVIASLKDKSLKNFSETF